MYIQEQDRQTCWMLLIVEILFKLQRNYSDEHTCLLLAPERIELEQVKQKQDL